MAKNRYTKVEVTKKRRAVEGSVVPLQLVETVSLETIKMLRLLLAEAERGELIGMACCSLYRRFEYGYTVAGAALTCPERAMGGLARLTQKINKYVDREGIDLL